MESGFLDRHEIVDIGISVGAGKGFEADRVDHEFAQALEFVGGAGLRLGVGTGADHALSNEDRGGKSADRARRTGRVGEDAIDFIAGGPVFGVLVVGHERGFFFTRGIRSVARHAGDAGFFLFHGGGGFFDIGLGAHDLALGVKTLFGAIGRLAIDIGGDANDGIAGSDHGGEQGFHFARKVIFDLLTVAHLAGRGAQGRVVFQIGRKHVSLLINDRHFIDDQALDGIGDEVADRVNGLDGDTIAAELHEDRGGGFDALTDEEEPVFGLHDHDARGGDAVELRDGAR